MHIKGSLVSLFTSGAVALSAVLSTGCLTFSKEARDKYIAELNDSNRFGGNTSVGGIDEYERRTIDGQVLGMHSDLARQRGDMRTGTILDVLGAVDKLDNEINERRRLERLRQEQRRTLGRIEENTRGQNNNSVIVVPQQNTLEFRFKEYSELSPLAQHFQTHHYENGYQIAPAFKEIKLIAGAVKYPESFEGLSFDWRENVDFNMLFGSEKYWKGWYFMINEVTPDGKGRSFIKRIEHRGRTANHGVIGIGPNGDVKLPPGLYEIEGNAGDMVEPGYSHRAIIRINP